VDVPVKLMYIRSDEVKVWMYSKGHTCKVKVGCTVSMYSSLLYSKVLYIKVWMYNRQDLQ